MLKKRFSVKDRGSNETVELKRISRCIGRVHLVEVNAFQTGKSSVQASAVP